MKAVILAVLSGEELQRFFEILERLTGPACGLPLSDVKVLARLKQTIWEADGADVGLAVEYAPDQD